MATTTIPWDDGSGDNIYISAPSQTGDQTVSVSSDANTGAARSKVVTFTATGVSPVTLTVNQAAGAVTPVFYTYLKFDGTAYIETSYVLPQNCCIGVNIGYESQKISQRVFRSQGGGGYILLNYGGSTNNTRRQIVVFYDSTSALASNRYVNFTYDSFSFFMTPNRYGIGNSVYTYTKGNKHPTGGIVFGDGIGGQAFTGRMSQFKVYDNSASNAQSATDLEENYTPIATFRPCTYNGEAGLWYVEGNTFFGNTAGSGTLTATNTV